MSNPDSQSTPEAANVPTVPNIEPETKYNEHLTGMDLGSKSTPEAPKSDTGGYRLQSTLEASKHATWTDQDTLRAPEAAKLLQFLKLNLYKNM